MDKRQQLLEVRNRRLERWEGCCGIGDYHGGAYETEYVSPYTKSAHEFDADVMVLLQDWASDKFLRRPFNQDLQLLGHAPNLVTNVNLKRLLKTHYALDLCHIYATNVFPFVKQGGMSARLSREYLDRAAREFALPQIEIVKPRIAICLGKSTFSSIFRASGCTAALPDDLVGRCFDYRGTHVWCQAHTGKLGTLNRGTDRIEHDWAYMKRCFDIWPDPAPVIGEVEPVASTPRIVGDGAM